MNPFTAHPRRQGVSYLAHLCFAMGIAWRLFNSVVAFALHAILPFMPIAPRLDLESTAAFLAERNRWIETADGTPGAGARSDLALLDRARGVRGLHVIQP